MIILVLTQISENANKDILEKVSINYEEFVAKATEANCCIKIIKMNKTLVKDKYKEYETSKDSKTSEANNEIKKKKKNKSNIKSEIKSEIMEEV